MHWPRPAHLQNIHRIYIEKVKPCLGHLCTNPLIRILAHIALFSPGNEPFPMLQKIDKPTALGEGHKVRLCGNHGFKVSTTHVGFSFFEKASKLSERFKSGGCSQGRQALAAPFSIPP